MSKGWIALIIIFVCIILFFLCHIPVRLIANWTTDPTNYDELVKALEDVKLTEQDKKIIKKLESMGYEIPEVTPEWALRVFGEEKYLWFITLGLFVMVSFPFLILFRYALGRVLIEDIAGIGEYQKYPLIILSTVLLVCWYVVGNYIYSYLMKELSPQKSISLLTPTLKAIVLYILIVFTFLDVLLFWRFKGEEEENEKVDYSSRDRFFSKY